MSSAGGANVDPEPNANARGCTSNDEYYWGPGGGAGGAGERPANLRWFVKENEKDDELNSAHMQGTSLGVGLGRSDQNNLILSGERPRKSALVSEGK